jgi:hypothetical protein
MMSIRNILLSVGACVLAVSAAALAQQTAPTPPSHHHTKKVTSIADPRTPVALSDDEINFIRREMRGLLDSVREIVDATAANDPGRIVAAGRKAGMNGPEATHIPQTLAPKLPPEFKKLGLATHRGFDQIALDAEKFGATDLTYRQLADLMNNCSACHATWRIVGEARR